MLLYNFKLISPEVFSLSYTNRGFQYNDGLFDTLISNQGHIRFLPDHLKRIQQAMQVLQLEVPTELQKQELFESCIQELVENNNLQGQQVRIKIQIWRAPGGLFTPVQDLAESLIWVQPQNTYPSIINQAGFSSTVQNSFSLLSFFKGPFAANYVLASLEKKQKQLDELILLDVKGHVSEVLTANIFWIKDNKLYTPALSSGCIAGILRKNILKVCATEHIEVSEGLFLPEFLLVAEVVLTCNITGIRFIQNIQEKEFSTSHPLIRLINQRLFN